MVKKTITTILYYLLFIWIIYVPRMPSFSYQDKRRAKRKKTVRFFFLFFFFFFCSTISSLHFHQKFSRLKINGHVITEVRTPLGYSHCVTVFYGSAKILLLWLYHREFINLMFVFRNQKERRKRHDNDAGTWFWKWKKDSMTVFYQSRTDQRRLSRQPIKWLHYYYMIVPLQLRLKTLHSGTKS